MENKIITYLEEIKHLHETNKIDAAGKFILQIVACFECNNVNYEEMKLELLKKR